MTSKKENTPEAGEHAQAAQPKVTFNTNNLKSSYANVCTVTSTREEVVLNFGINQNWDRGPNELEIELTDRIILSPFAAQRLLSLLTNLMGEYQNRYGNIGHDDNSPSDA